MAKVSKFFKVGSISSKLRLLVDGDEVIFLAVRDDVTIDEAMRNLTALAARIDMPPIKSRYFKGVSTWADDLSCERLVKVTLS